MPYGQRRVGEGFRLEDSHRLGRPSPWQSPQVPDSKLPECLGRRAVSEISVLGRRALLLASWWDPSVDFIDQAIRECFPRPFREDLLVTWRYVLISYFQRSGDHNAIKRKAGRGWWSNVRGVSSMLKSKDSRRNLKVVQMAELEQYRCVGVSLARPLLGPAASARAPTSL